MTGWLIHDQDPLSEPTRAQDAACESLARDWDRVEVANLPDGRCQATCMMYEAPGGYRIRAVVRVEPDGRKL